jgi:hypothetical protein
MKHYNRIIIVLAFLLLNSCIEIDKFPPTFHESSFSTVTYIKNTLDYSILIQCYFRPFNNDSLWCEKEMIEFSEPIEIQPNESQIVMDYVIPCGIKIFNGSDTTLLFENYELNNRGYKHLPDSVMYYSHGEAEKIGNFTSAQIVPEHWLRIFNSGYYIQNERYLCENVLWDLYPIRLEFYNCSEISLGGDEDIKYTYKNLTNGYALVNCILLNKNAECFAR